MFYFMKYCAASLAYSKLEIIQRQHLKLQTKWQLIHIPSVYLLTYSLICPHNALVSQLKPVPGFWACFQNILCIRCIDSLAISSVLQPYSMFPDFLNEKRFARFIYYIIILVPPLTKFLTTPLSGGPPPPSQQTTSTRTTIKPTPCKSKFSQS